MSQVSSLMLSHHPPTCAYLSYYTLRGITADVMYLEEAAFMDPSIFYEVVVPLLENRGTALICISTLLDSQNFFTQLCKARNEDGSTVFDVISIERICSNCKRLPLLEQKISCTHKEGSVPMVKSYIPF